MATQTPAQTQPELTLSEKAHCKAAAQRAGSALYASHRPERPTMREAIEAEWQAYSETAARLLAERHAPAETADAAFWAAEMARQAEETARLDAAEDERFLSERDDAFDAMHEPADDSTDDFYGGDF